MARGGDGGAGGPAGGQVFHCYKCTITGPTGGAGGPGGSSDSGGARPKPIDLGSAPVSSSVISRCTLRIAGSPVVDAQKCFFEKLERSFSIVAGSENRKYVYKMAVALNDDKTGRGFLEGGKTPGRRALGTMTQERACWVSLDKSVELCAWK
ncbi:hypothetical protein FF100_00455 [Methylobacterium terricola]|uniref:Uncharacterized protein n=1 Tax=Methylobacterium terricola TaxID=2583531 RepID=A0A5C4LLX2_9HYPH|nr:hypothetical protein [Methylobacterium terricola]TNC15781.1 hypothetical protein FF100_00455 [Methylobacterium terricola]